MKRVSLRTLAIGLLALALPVSTVMADFEEAQAYIDLDGSLVGYINFEDDGKKIGAALNEIYQQVQTSTPEMPPIPIDFDALIEQLGFGSLKAFALSSKTIEPGLYRNRSVALLKGEPKGLFAISSSQNLGFTAAALAPADATGALTATVDLRPLRDTVSQIMQQIMGPMGEALVQQQLAQDIPQTDLNYGDLIELLSGKWDAFWHQRYGSALEQDIRFWIRIEGAGSALPRLRPMAESMGVAFIEDANRIRANFSPVLGPDASFGLYLEATKDGEALIIHSHSDWTSGEDGARLIDQPSYQNLAERLPEKGSAFYYDAGTDLEPLLAAMEAIPEAARYRESAQLAMDLLIGGFFEPEMTVSYFDGDHWVSDQYAGYSTKQVIMTVPAVVGIGLGSAMAIPAFQKVRETSQQKAVENNLRQIAAASDQYFLENGVNEVRIDQLVGENGYIRELNPVAGERYEGMVIRQGEPISVILGDGTVVSTDF